MAPQSLQHLTLFIPAGYGTFPLGDHDSVAPQSPCTPPLERYHTSADG